MKKLLLMVILTTTMAAQAEERRVIEQCESNSEIASSLFSARHHGIPLADSMKAVEIAATQLGEDPEPLLKLVMSIYEQARIEDPESVERLEGELRDQVFMTCYKQNKK